MATNPMQPLLDIIEHVHNLEVQLSDNAIKMQVKDEQIAALTRTEKDKKIDAMVDAAMMLASLKIPYKFGAEYHNNKAFDCSSFIQALFKWQGYDLPRTSQEQSQMQVEEITPKNVQRGDLLFFDKINGDGKVDHVGMYLGNKTMLHTVQSTGIAVFSLSDEYLKKLAIIRRVIV